VHIIFSISYSYVRERALLQNWIVTFGGQNWNSEISIASPACSACPAALSTLAAMGIYDITIDMSTDLLFAGVSAFIAVVFIGMS
jgi:hypothetical protein